MSCSIPSSVRKQPKLRRFPRILLRPTALLPAAALLFTDRTAMALLPPAAAACHELGHLATGALHKVSSPYELVERSEYRANRYVARTFLTEEAFREAFAAGCTELWQLAEYFDLPEADIKNALTYWSERQNVNFNT